MQKSLLPACDNRSDVENAERRVAERGASHEELFEEHYSWLLRWALTLNDGRHSEAEDLVHDLFIQLVRLRPRIHSEPDHVRSYLYTMLRNMQFSKLRRAQRSPICELSVIDYDSFEQGMRSVPEESLSAVSTQLWQVCEYMCERKKRSSSASVLLLRFFLGYFPSEIARILRTTRVSVDKHLHAARRDARSAVSRPHALGIFGRKRSLRELPQFSDGSHELFLALRRRIFSSREGECFAREALQRAYVPASSESLRASEIAHLVSCSDCLDTLNRILGIRLLADRCPSKTLGRDGGPPRDGGSGGGSSSFEHMERVAVRRLEEENEHCPTYLQVAVNGDVKDSRKITSKLSEFRVKVDWNRELEFIELFSEQNIRLLYLPIACLSNPSRSVEEARIQLSDGRTLDVSVSFPEDGAVICVRYYNPLFAEKKTIAKPALVALFDKDRRSKPILIEPRSFRHLFLRPWNFYRRREWVWGMAIVTASILTVSGFLLQRHIRPFESPGELLQRASRHAAAEIPPQDLVQRTIRVQQLDTSGQIVNEDSVVEWASADSKRRARRLFNHDGALVAEEITRGGDTQFYGKVGSTGISKLNPAHLEARDVWQITPSAAQFQALTAPAVPSVMQKDDHYTIRYQNPASELRPGLVEATLVLRRNDLHAVEEDLVLRSDGELHRFRLLESSYDYYPPSQTQKDVFAPDKALLGSSSNTAARTRFSGTFTSVEVSPNLVIHALYLLSSVGADMNGETNVESTADGTLRITGTVATRDRRDEILRAVAPLRAQGGVVIRLLTADQFHTRAFGGRSAPAIEVIQPAESTIPLDRQVRQFLSDQGTSALDMEKAVANFSQQVLVNADEAQQHAWALDRVATRLTQTQLASLSPEARKEWVQMADLHGSALLRCVQTIRTELAHLGLPNQVADASVKPIADAEGFSHAADQMLILSRSCDHDLASAFTLSASPVGSEALNEQRFWRSLDMLQALARETAAVNQILERASVQPRR